MFQNHQNKTSIMPQNYFNWMLLCWRLLLCHVVSGSRVQQSSLFSLMSLLVNLIVLNTVLFFILRISLDICSAVKSRDSMSKLLYDSLFKQIVAGVNRKILSSSSTAYIGILDIAGNGNYYSFSFRNFDSNVIFTYYLIPFNTIAESKTDVPNSFDQLCIN